MTTPTEPTAAPGTGSRPRRRARGRVAALVGLSALVVAILAATGSLMPETPGTSPSSPAVGPPNEPHDGAIVVSALHTPMSVAGSDGVRHVEYDLVVTNTAPTPAALTVVEVLAPDGRSLLRLDGAALVAATQLLDDMSPTREISGSTAVAEVVDLQLASTSRLRSSPTESV